MTLPILSDAMGALEAGATSLVLKIAGLLLSPGSQFSLLSLMIAFVIAVAFLRLKRRSTRPLRTKVVLRALFPKSITHSASTRADLGFMAFSVLLFGALLGWALLSYGVVGSATERLLTTVFGAPVRLGLNQWTVSALLTIALVLAYELGYWIDHWLSHNVPFFWEAHKVHHSAEVLTPLTVFRMHPIDTIKFSNIIALFMGATHGMFDYLVGSPVTPIMVAGANVLVLVFMLFSAQLQHSQLWIPFTGVWGRIFISPAHHQVHHSTNPADFGKNLGGFLAIFDWAFGTLRLPNARREAISFGVTPASPHHHTIMGGLAEPTWLAFGHLWRPVRRLMTRPAPSRRQVDLVDS